MAESTIKLKLETSLKDLDKARGTPGLNLTKQQQASFETNKKGAEMALDAGDLKNFRKYFNSLAEILKNATAASGKLDKNVEELAKRQDEVNKEIKHLTEKRDALKKNITSSKGEGTLSKAKANELLSGFKDKGQILGKGGTELKEATTINARVRSLAEELEKAGKT